MGPIEAERPHDGEQPSLDDYLDRRSWNKLIDTETWAKEDVAAFQRLIDGRTLSLTKMLMEESGIVELIGVADCLNTSSGASSR